MTAEYARVWLSAIEGGRFMLASLRNGIYYCGEHAQDANAESGVPLLSEPRVLAAYHQKVIIDAGGIEQESAAPPGKG